MKKTKKLVALGLAFVLAMSTSCMTFADVTTSGTQRPIEGDGAIEGYIPMDLFTVTLPTTADADFTIDPQELLRLSDSSTKIDNTAAKDVAANSYGSKVLFGNASAGYTTKSGDYTIVNKSSYDVKVDLKVDFAGLTKADSGSGDGYTIGIVDNTASGYTAGTKTDLYMSVTQTPGTLVGTTGTDSTTPEDIKTTKLAAASTTISTTLGAAPDTMFKVTGSSKADYAYAIDDTKVATSTLQQVKFNLSGTVNTAADWTNFSKDSSAALKMNLTFTIDKVPTDVAPTYFGATASYTLTDPSQNLVVNLDLGSGSLADKSLDGVFFLNADESKKLATYVEGTDYTYDAATGKLTLLASGQVGSLTSAQNGTYKLGVSTTSASDATVNTPVTFIINIPAN